MKITTKQIYLGVLILVVVYVIYKSGILNPKAQPPIDSVKNAKDGSTPSHQSGGAEYESIATSIYNTFTDNWLLWNNTEAITVLERLNGMNDADLIEVSNAFNVKFAGKTPSTLKATLQGEYLTFWSNQADTLRDEVVKRLTGLNA